jgi:hypothetical protein
MSECRRPPRPDPAEPADTSGRALVWTTVGVNALLGLFALAGWLNRPRPCPGGCSWRPAGGMLWVILAILDVGLVLVWAGVGYAHLTVVGERIGRRIADRRDGGSNGP